MGDKTEARRRMQAAGVPVVPGIDRVLRDAAEARAGGRTSRVSGAAQGGGRRRREGDARRARPRGRCAARSRRRRREATKAFGDGSVYLEKYIERPRHVEIQVLADAHGRVVALGERECCIQRRHQKLIEESPSVAVTPGLRRRMGEAADGGRQRRRVRRGRDVRVPARSRRRVLLPRDEHPDPGRASRSPSWCSASTWCGSSCASPPGSRCAWRLVCLQPRGHAIECRITAEDPVQWLPARDRRGAVPARAGRSRCPLGWRCRGRQRGHAVLRPDAGEAHRLGGNARRGDRSGCSVRCASS